MSLSDYMIGIKYEKGGTPPNPGHTCRNCKHFHPASDGGYYCSKYNCAAESGETCASWEMKDSGQQNQNKR